MQPRLGWLAVAGPALAGAGLRPADHGEPDGGWRRERENATRVPSRTGLQRLLFAQAFDAAKNRAGSARKPERVNGPPAVVVVGVAWVVGVAVGVESVAGVVGAGGGGT